MAAMAAASSLFSDNSDNVQAPTISSSVPSVSECSHRGGFRGMFKVPSLVFDIELEDNGIGGHWQEDDWEEDEVVSEIQRFTQPATPAEARLLSDVRVACPHAKDGQDTARLVSILSALGYKCGLRTALGGGDGADCLRNLRHTFIMCETPAAAGAPARRYIIDAQFREQFIIAKTTARYAAILAAVPQVFVGPEEHLALLVNFLCAEMSTAFRGLGSVLPPWRHASSMLSKWKPRNSIDDGLGPRPLNGGENGATAAANGGSGLLLQQQQPGASQLDWPCKPAPLQPHNHQLHHWQQAAMAQQRIAADATAGGSRRQSFEPLRVVFGGNFVPIIITPSPAPAS